VSRTILLDAGPLGMVTNPKSSPETTECKAWFAARTAAGDRIVVPEIADYEVRRELIRSSRLQGLARLDWLRATFTYAPITTAIMLRAASFWAAARLSGRPSADDRSLDADMILAAQADVLRATDSPLVATTNPRHLTLFCDARHWRDIA
jgi:predicted nucleic acid-binding protein